MEVIRYVERGGTVSHIVAECQPRLWSTSQARVVPRPVSPSARDLATPTYTRWATPPLLGTSLEMRKVKTREFDERISLLRCSCEGGTLGRAASAAGVWLRISLSGYLKVMSKYTSA